MGLVENENIKVTEEKQKITKQQLDEKYKKLQRAIDTYSSFKRLFDEPIFTQFLENFVRTRRDKHLWELTKIDFAKDEAARYAAAMVKASFEEAEIIYNMPRILKNNSDLAEREILELKQTEK
jgi:hypothetical protein